MNPPDLTFTRRDDNDYGFRPAIEASFTGPDGQIFSEVAVIGPDGEEAARTALTHWATIAYGGAKRRLDQPFTAPREQIFALAAMSVRGAGGASA